MLTFTDYTAKNNWARFDTDCRKVSNRGQGGARIEHVRPLRPRTDTGVTLSIRAVRQTPYKKNNGTAPTERTDTVIPYRIAHVYVLESGLDIWPCTSA